MIENYKFSEKFMVHVGACTPITWLVNYEPEYIVDEITTLARGGSPDFVYLQWDIVNGLVATERGSELSYPAGTAEAWSNFKAPQAVIQALDSIREATDKMTGSTHYRIVITFSHLDKMMHRAGASADADTIELQFLQMLENVIPWLKENRVMLSVLTTSSRLPERLSRRIAVLEYDLPTREDLEGMARSMIKDSLVGTYEKQAQDARMKQDRVPASKSSAELDDEVDEIIGQDEDEFERVLDASQGLTYEEAESAYAQSIVVHGYLQSDFVWAVKTAAIKKTGLMEVHRGGTGFDSLGGLSYLKTFTRKSLINQMHRKTKAKPKGVLLVGFPGAGKSAFAKSLGAETGRPVLQLDFGRVMAGIVGASEGNLRQALKVADAMAPVILYIDEVEKGLSGTKSSGSTDGGVGSRVFGTFLTWLNDHTSDVYVIATANDISAIPPEFARPGRFDSVFFLDLPDREEKDIIWDLYREKYDVPEDDRLPSDDNWVGSDIETCCKLSELLDCSLEEAAGGIQPVTLRDESLVPRLRDLADGCYSSASYHGTYRKNYKKPKDEKAEGKESPTGQQPRRKGRRMVTKQN